MHLTGSSFNVTILKMINNNKNCSDANKTDPDTFCWSKEQEELLLASYYIGYMFQLPGGLLANQYGAYFVCGLGVSLSVVLTLVTPVVAMNCDWTVLLALRLVQGLAVAPTFPALSAMWTKWAPKHELSFLFSFTAAGNFIGAALADVLAGLLSDQKNILGGSWPSVFRIFGIVGILWAVLWMTFASSDPDKSIWTSLDEKDYIKMNRVPLRRNTSIPWLWILTSTKCWAIYFCHVCSYFGYLTMLVGYPQYFHDVHNMKIEDLGAWSALPILCMFLTSLIAGKMTDIILKRGLTSVTSIRKINTAIGMFIPAILNFVLASCPDLSVVVVTVLMSLQNAANGFVLPGFQVNYIDINPDHAGVTRGVGNSLASSAGVIIPILLYRYNMEPKHLAVKEAGSGVQSQWKHMFASVGIVMTIGGIIYCLVGTGRRQMEGMEGYVEIAGTDSAAERTTYQTTSQNNSSTAQLDVPEVPGEVPGEVPDDGHTEVKLRPPSRASIDWSGSDITARSTVHIPGVPTGGTVHIPGVPTGGTGAESQHKVEVSGETCDVGDECVEVADLIMLEDPVLDTIRAGSDIEQTTSSKDKVPSDPGDLVTPNPCNLATSDSGNLATSDSGNLVTTDPGCIAKFDPGDQATSDPENLVTTDPGCLATSDLSNLATSDPGNLVTTDPGCLATPDPGNQVILDPGNLLLATSDPGNLITTESGCLATSDPGNLVTTDPGYQVTPASPDIRPADEVEETKWPSVKKIVAEIAAGPVVVHRNISKQTPIRQGLPARRYSLQSTRESLQSTRERSEASSKRRFSTDVPRFASENKQKASQPVVENIQNKKETTYEGLVTDDLDESGNDIAESKEFDTESKIVDQFGDGKSSEDKADPEESDQVANDEPTDKIPRKFSMNSMLADMM